MNIPDMILKALGSGGTTNAISSILNLNQDQTKKAMTAAVPSLLAGLAGLASTPQGAEQLASAASKQDTSILDNLGGFLSNQGSRAADQGSDLLGSLFGGGAISKLGGLLSKFTGLGEGAIGKLLGLLGPVVLGFLGKQQKTMGLGASGLANLLATQKENIRAMMPAGLENMISTSLPGFGKLAESTRTAAGEVVSNRTFTEPEPWAPRTERTTSSAARWALPLALALAALVAYLLWSNRPRPTQEATGAPAIQRDTMVRTEASSSVVTDSTKLINQATTVLNGITDEASARAAVAQLKDINTSLGGMQPLLNQLPDSTKATTKTTLQPMVEKLRQSADAVLKIPGVGNIIRPFVEEMLTKFGALTA